MSLQQHRPVQIDEVRIHDRRTADQPTTTEYRIAGAPISWGVCEVPGWGYQLSPDRVLAEMRDVGLLATELGPDGLPARRPRRRWPPCSRTTS